MDDFDKFKKVLLKKLRAFNENGTVPIICLKYCTTA
jgi:hypothetical protein